MTPLSQALEDSKISGSELARQLGTSRQNVARWASGQIEFPKEHAARAARILGVTEEFLVLGKKRGPIVGSFDPDEPDPLAQHGDDRPDAAPHKADFPRDAMIELSPRGGAGNGEIAATALTREIDGVSEVDAIRPDYWRFPQRFLNETLRRSATALIVIECEGDSMKPTLAPGERVWVDTSHRIPSPDGIYALRDRFDNIIVKRVQLDETGENPMLLIISDNDMHPTSRRGLDEVHIVGKVVGGFRML
jgi:phage repressor protein C with HTH and peptisase S24 domain